MAKSGPPQMMGATLYEFALDVQNAGDSPAHQVTLLDQLPDGATGGMCDVAPALVSARIFDAGGINPVSPTLSEGVDFTTSFAGCLWTLAFTSPQTVLGPDGVSHSFEIGAFDKHRLLNGLDEIGVTLEYQAQVESYENEHFNEYSWMGR